MQKFFWWCVMALLAMAYGDTVAPDGTYVPRVPDYADPSMWFSVRGDTAGVGADVFYIVSTWETDWTANNGRISHYANPYNSLHRNRMRIEQRKVADYMADGNNFYAPYYRHTTIEAWATQNEDSLSNRLQLAMGDVRRAFDHFLEVRDPSRPFVLAGFSQGGRAVVELLKYMSDDAYRYMAAAYVLGYKVTPADTLDCRHIVAARDSADVGVTICYNTVKDVKYVCPVISAPCAMCINPVNWRTDATPAILADTITVSVDTLSHVLVVKNYEGKEYAPILEFLNVGDIHGCEPWLYKECLRRNIGLRVRKWRQQAGS